MIEPSTTSWSPGASTTTSSSTTAVRSTTTDAPSRTTVRRGAATTLRRSSVRFERSSWAMPMTALNTITIANRTSRGSPTTSTTTASTVISALNRVKTLLRTISPSDRDEESSTWLTLPAATRSATAPLVRPGSRTAGTVVPASSVGRRAQAVSSELAIGCPGVPHAAPVHAPVTRWRHGAYQRVGRWLWVDISIGCHFTFDVPTATHAVVLVEPHVEEESRVVAPGSRSSPQSTRRPTWTASPTGAAG